MAQWRRFSFFDRDLLKDNNGNWLRGVDVTCMSGNRGLLIVGDAQGYIHMANRQLETRAFRAYDHFVSHVVMMKKTNVLVSIGDGKDPRDPDLIESSKAVAEANRTQDQQDQQQMYASTGSVHSSTALVKMWRTDQQDREGKPKLILQLKIFAKFPEEAVTAFAVSEDASQIAVGLSNGAIILFRSEMKRRAPGMSGGGPPLLLQSAINSPVTNLCFAVKPKPVANKSIPENALYLYAATKRGLTCYHCDDVKAKNSIMPRSIVLDERGVALHCGCVNEDGDMCMGQTDAVYFYTPEDRTGCFGFEGEKKYLGFFKHYLLVAHADSRGRNQLNIYDLQNKCIAFNWILTNTAKALPGSTSRNVVATRFGYEEVEEIRHVVSEFGAVFVVTSFGSVYRLSEKDTASKLSILFDKNLYPIAISLAFSSNYDLSSIMDIFRMYGDYLYNKGDFDGSLRQYARTIGHVEPSYVIRRFLDAQRIHNLTTYLETLHNKGFATAEHTTLLLNCYTKLKDVKKLDAFLLIDDDGTSSKEGTPQALTFDVETALTVLRENYPQHALALAKKHNEHSWYLKIQLDRISDSLSDVEQARVADALEYIRGLSFAEADMNLRKYGRTLVTHLPGPTTELLKQLCTGRFSANTNSKSDPGKITLTCAPTKIALGDFLHLFVSHRAQLREFLEYIVQVESVSNTSIGNTLLEMVLNDTHKSTTDPAGDELDEDHAVAEEPVPTQSTSEAAVLSLLDNPRVKYDEDHALILMQMHGLKQGKRYLYQKLHMYHMLLQHHMEEGEDAAVLELVKQQTDSNLWLLALRYFAERGPYPKNGPNTDEWSELKQLLSLVDVQPSLQIPPLQVVSILSQSREIPLSVVRPYVVSQLKKDQAHIEADTEEIKKYKQDTQKMRSQMAALSSKAVVFQATKCDLCNHDLDLPVVHFMCGHSYHQNCISETERECITCAPEHRHLLSLKQSLEVKAGNHEQFFNQLETAADGFNTIAEYFGKGIFKAEVPVETERSSNPRFSNEL
ncbi:vacuolar protein sorting-associated protein [Thraustotheca clavata]|uniref:Vacuolar protein sorting-associated protein 11 homolog n=1 Tax=Thraustotheca clavata TaxID=74557 RepID=A0A1V9Z4N5_9STRA|nr:vacuolar protein sorting-associated protein [Thraustotheca clavata]